MTPSLFGRLQTRFVLVVVVGLPWTVIVTVLSAVLAGESYADTFGVTSEALLLVLVLGLLLWEPLYHALQQLRWEKDWPTVLGLVTGLNEGLLVWLLLGEVDPLAFLVHFVSTWLLIWFVLHGPLRAVVPRWRYRGGRFV